MLTLRQTRPLLSLRLIAGLLVGGCSSLSNTEKGAIIGQRMDKKAKELDQELENAEVERVGEGIKVTFDSGLLFDFESAKLRPAAERDLAEFANSMEEFEGTKILIVRHTDAKGSESYNKDLSEAACSVGGRIPQGAGDCLLPPHHERHG